MDKKLYAINSDFSHADASVIEILLSELSNPSYTFYQRKPLSIIDQRIEPTIEVTTNLIQNYRYAATENDSSTLGRKKIEPYDTYRTVIKVKTKNGLLPFQECNLSFSEPMTAIINGTQQEVDELEVLPVNTLSTGEIIIEVNATSLTPPLIHLSIEHNTFFKRAFFLISLYEEVNKKLLDVSRDYITLLGAKDHNNQSLISDDEIRGNTDSLQSACQSLQETLRYINKSSMGSTVIPKDSSTGKPVKRNVLKDTLAWSLDFDNEGAPQYFNLLTPQESEALFKRDTRSTEDLESAWNKFKEFFGETKEAVKELRIVKVVLKIADGVEKGIEIAVDFFIDKVKYFGKIIADGIEGLNNIFTAIQGLFQSMKVGIEKLINWLKEVFSWDDILRTKIMLKHVALESFEIIKALTDYTTQQMITSLKTFNHLSQDKIESWINEINGTISSNLNDKFTGNTLVKKDYKVHNIFKDSYTAHVDQHGLALPSTATDITFNFDFFDAAGMTDIESMIIRTYRELTEIDLGDLISNPSKFFTTLLKAVLRLLSGMINYGIQAIERLIKVIESLLNKVIDGIKTLLTAELKIPFVKDLYLYITSHESTLTSEKTGTFNLLDIFSLMSAIPVSVIYKATHDAKPLFASNDALDQAQKAITAKLILSSMDIPTSALIPRDAKDDVNDKIKQLQGAAKICSIIDAILLGLLALVEPIADGYIDVEEYIKAKSPRIETLVKDSPYFSKFQASETTIKVRELGILILELIHLPLSFPYFTISEMEENKKPSHGLTITNFNIDVRYFFTSMAAFYLNGKRLHLWESKNGSMIASLVGALQLGVTIATFVAAQNETASSEDPSLNGLIKDLQAYDFIKEYSLSVTRMFKFLRSVYLLQEFIEEPPMIIGAIVSLQTVDVAGYLLALGSSAYSAVLIDKIMDYIAKHPKKENNAPEGGARHEENRSMAALPAPTAVVTPLIIPRDSPLHQEAKKSKVKKHAAKIEEVTEERENTADKAAKM